MDQLPATPKSLGAVLAPYREPDVAKSVWQLSNSSVLLVLTLVLMYLTLKISYLLTLTLSVPAAFFLMRLFIIQHDCGHGSFFRNAKVADAVGSIIGVFTLTPYHYWKKTHAIHHATSGNLEHRGFGDISTLTVDEYLALSWFGKLKYRLYRHPAVLFGVGPAFQFLVKHRIPTIIPREWKRERFSIVWTDLVLAGFVGVMALTVGLKAFLLVHLPITLLSCSLGVWLFYVQHQFEDTYWEHDERWEYDEAAVKGSSYYQLPRLFQWLTGNIGLHHIHHLNPRIPNYKLQRVFDDLPEMRRVTRLTFLDSLRCISLTLWDEREQRLVGWRRLRELRRRPA